MLSWFVRPRQVAKQTEADATALIAERGNGAYAECRRRERAAFNAEDASRWRSAAVAVARRTGRQIGLDTATRIVADADMTTTPDVARVPRPARPSEEIDPLKELSTTIARGERRDG
jgi:hypothetical protein